MRVWRHCCELFSNFVFLTDCKQRNGRRKKVYEPIYNRIIWRYLFTGTYMALLKGLTGRVTMIVVRTIEGQVKDVC